MMTLEMGLSKKQEDRLSAVDVVTEIMDAGIRGNREQQTTGASHESGPSGNRNENNGKSEKVSHNVSMRLEGRDKKFSGSL